MPDNVVMAPTDLSALRGRMVRVWLQQSDVAQAEAARRVGDLTRAGLHHWLSGRVTPDATRVAALDAALEAGGVMAHLWRAAGTPEAWPARCAWDHNFRLGEPAWVWVRSAASVPILAQFRWGAALAGQVTLPPGPGGLVAFAPTSVDNPPLQVRLEQPGGWVDFGHGSFTHAVLDEGLGASLVSHLDVLDRHHVEEGTLRDPVVANSVGVGLGRARALLSEHGLPWRVVQQNLHAFVPARTVHDHHPGPVRVRCRTDGSPEVLVHLDGEALARVRTARGFTQRETAAAVTALQPSEPITRDVIRGLEADSRGDRAGLVWRLDHVYEADGFLGVDRCPARRHGQTWSVIYPPEWVGPVWIHVHADTPGVVELLWSPWLRRQRLDGPATLAFRKSSDGQGVLRVAAAPHVSVSSGTGIVPGSLDINAGWYPQSILASAGLLRTAIGILVGRSPVLGTGAPGSE